MNHSFMQVRERRPFLSRLAGRMYASNLRAYIEAAGGAIAAFSELLKKSLPRE